MLYHLTAAALAFAALSVPAADPQSTDTVVVTAARLRQPLNHLLADVRVIDAEAIAASGAQTLTELLQAKGGVEIVANGGPGQVSGVFLRGTNSNHVVVLIDGVRINSATTGTTAFENIPVEQIEKIEILNGAASGLYGADAIGGVIQIFLKKGGAARANASAGYGRYATSKLSAGFAAGDTTRISAQVGYQRSDGFSATNPSATFTFDPDDDGYRDKSGNVNFAHDFATGHTFSLRGFGSEGRTQFDGGLGADEVNRQRLATLAVEADDQWTPGWRSLVRAARGTDDIVTTGSIPGRFRTRQDQITWQNDINAVIGTLVAGAEYAHAKVASDTAYARDARTVQSLFAGFTGSVEAHRVQASLRHDDFSDFGGQTTGGFTYAYQLTPRLRIAATVASAFKAPSFNDLYFPLSFGFSGNPDLKPERALNREIGVYYDRAGSSARLVAFANRIRDLIVIDASFTTLVNLDEARIRGVTATVSQIAGPLRAQAEITHQSPEDQATGHLLPRRARTHGTASLAGDAGPLRLGLELVASGARFDRASNDPALRMGGYALLNLLARWQVSPEFALRARLDNALDKRYELAQGYNTPGASLFIAAELSLR